MDEQVLEDKINDSVGTTDVEITNPSPDLFIRKSNSSKYIVEYHRDLCTGAVVCSLIAPNTFVMDEENKAKMIQAVEVDKDEAILAAAQSCPALAIFVRDAETGEQLFPPPQYEF